MISVDLEYVLSIVISSLDEYGRKRKVKVGLINGYYYIVIV